MNKKQNGYQLGHDLPHEHVLDNLNLSLDDLNARLRTEIRRVDDIYARFMVDGILDDSELKELITESYKVAVQIQAEYDKTQNANTSNVGIIGGILLVIGAAIGIKQLTK